MTMQKITRGLNIPISGTPVQEIRPGPRIGSVAILGDDYLGFRPTMLVKEGDAVRLGQPVMTDKSNPRIVYTAPGSGTVSHITRGAKRRFEALTVELDGNDERDPVRFPAVPKLADLDREQIHDRLLQSGLWVSLRTRPYSKVPDPGQAPHSIFVTAMDTQPLAAEPELIIEQRKDDFVAGLQVLKLLTDGPVFVCVRNDSRVPGNNVPGVRFEVFTGPHPAGLPGTHIHFLDPVNSKKTVWHINYQDVIAVGHLFSKGTILTERILSIAGPSVVKPGLYRARLGANIDDLTRGQLSDGDHRIISGSVLHGRMASPPNNFLGRYHVQVSALREGHEREFLGWQRPGPDKFSVTKVYVGSWLRHKLFPMTTTLNGSERAIVPIGTYERVMPLDIMPTHLLKALIVGDTDSAQALGVLELDEEDLALCTFVCPGKYEYGSILRGNLARIEKEG
jgi:Na+-transporting NADH:ubiquinone oxidoreductase subunit A